MQETHIIVFQRGDAEVAENRRGTSHLAVSLRPLRYKLQFKLGHYLEKPAVAFVVGPSGGYSPLVLTLLPSIPECSP